MTKREHRILLVDDEQAVLDGLRRQHRKTYSLDTACGAEAGLEAVQENGPFDVVVTDYSMPGMTGTQLLAELRWIESDLLGIMLTGQADLDVAIDAINRGHIFRFLTKPCEPELFRTCVDAALEQRRLRTAERDLLEQTVRGAIEVLADVLELSNPAAFGKAARIRDLTRHVVERLRLQDGWQFETAALLSQLGCVAMPDDFLERLAAGEALTGNQKEMFESHPQVARDLLVKIPRLQAVAEIIRHQRPCSDPSEDARVVRGGKILAAAIDFDEQMVRGESRTGALDALSRAGHEKGVLRALATARTTSVAASSKLIEVSVLTVGMVLHEDVYNTEEALILSAGHRMTESSLQRLRNYAQLGRLKVEAVRVRVGESQSGDGEKKAAEGNAA